MRTLTVVPLLLLVAVAANASIIAEVSGAFSSNASVASPDPFGGYDYAAASWTQTVGYSGVNILFQGQSAFSSAAGIAYLTTAFGPGTTASDQIATAAFTVPLSASATEVPLFSDLSLAPGTYYLILAADAGDQIEWNVTDTPAITSAGGVTVNQGMGCFNGSSPAGYPPGTTGGCVSDDLLFTVSNSSAVPEPSTLQLGIGACLFAWLLHVARRRRVIG